MAYNTHWKIPFTADNGTEYEIRIATNNYSGSVITLQPGLEPITTEEDSSDDQWQAMRPQSGYIRFITDFSTWQAMFPTSPTSHQVTLWNAASEETVWWGFLIPQTFSSSWAGTDEREMPIQCPLSILRGVDYQTTNINRQNIASVIDDIFAQWIGMQPLLYVSNYISSLDLWLGLEIQCLNFQDRDDSGIVTTEYTYYDVLEEICKVFGLTARTYRGNLYLTTTHIGHSFNMVTDHDVAEKAATPSTVLEPEEVEIDINGIDGAPIADTNGQLELINGYRNISIESELNKTGDKISIPTEGIEEHMGEPQRYTGMQNEQVWYYWNRLIPYPYNSVSNALVTAYYKPQTGSSALTHNWSHIAQFDSGISKVDYDAGKKVSYSFSTALHLILNNATTVSGRYHFDSESYFLRLLTRNSYIFSETFLSININASESTISRYICRLKIGNKYWNGSAWTTTASTFTIEMYEDTKNVQAKNFGKSLSDCGSGTGSAWHLTGYNSATGYCIKIDSGSGVVDFQILSCEGSESQERVSIKDVIIQMYQENSNSSDNDGVSKNVYKAKSSYNFTDDYSQSNKLATFKAGNSSGLGLMFNQGGSVMQNFEFYDDNPQDPATYLSIPEQDFMNRIKRNSGKTSKRYTFTQLGNCDSVPSVDIYTRYSAEYYIIHVAHNWIRNHSTIICQSY